MPYAAVDAPAVIDNRRIATHRQRSGKYDHAACGGNDLQTFTTAEIQAAVEGEEFLFGALADIGAAVAIARGKAIGEDGWVFEDSLPVFLWAGGHRQIGDLQQLRIADGRVDCCRFNGQDRIVWV